MLGLLVNKIVRAYQIYLVYRLLILFIDELADYKN